MGSTPIQHSVLICNSVLNVKAVVAAFNQEKALVGAFSVITNLRMELFEALLTSLTTAAAPSAGEPLQMKQMRIIFFMDGEYLDQHNYQIKTFIFQSHNNTNRPLHSKDFVYLSDIIKLLNNKEMK